MAALPHRGEQPVVAQELQPLDDLRRAVAVVGPEAVKLSAGAVVDVEVLVLRRGEPGQGWGWG